MPLPAKQKTWAFPAMNTRITGTGVVLTIARPLVRGIKDALKLISGVTVVGSSNGVAAGLDAVDRWSADADLLWSTAGARSWIVLNFANMGGAELLISCAANSPEGTFFSWSPGGLYTGGSTTADPTATDNQANALPAIMLGGNLSQDRIYTVGASTDGSCWYLLIANGGTYLYGFIMQALLSTVVAPATFSPSVVTYGWTSRPTALTTVSPNFPHKARANSVNVTWSWGFEGFTNGGAHAASTVNGTAELQGTAYVVQPLSAWTVTPGAKGKLGNMYDVWGGVPTASDGDTYPANGDREMIQAGALILPWNGLPGVPGTNPVLT